MGARSGVRNHVTAARTSFAEPPNAPGENLWECMYVNRFRYACTYSAPCRKSPGRRNKRSQGTARRAGASISGSLLLGGVFGRLRTALLAAWYNMGPSWDSNDDGITSMAEEEEKEAGDTNSIIQ